MEDRSVRWWWFLWPGLAQVFMGREFDGLVRALVFAVLLNAGVLCTFVWQEAVPVSVVRVVWLGAVVFWVGSLLQSLWVVARLGSEASAERRDALYRTALQAIVRRQWRLAQESAGELLRLRPSDADAAMLMAAACLLAGDEARAHLYLNRVRSTDGGKWEWEASHLAEVWKEWSNQRFDEDDEKPWESN